MRVRKVDANQAEIVAALRQMGCSVTPTHIIGKGFPDIAVGYRGKNFLIEIKNGTAPKSDRLMTEDEMEWHSGWRGQAAIVENVQDAINLVTQ